MLQKALHDVIYNITLNDSLNIEDIEIESRFSPVPHRLIKNNSNPNKINVIVFGDSYFPYLLLSFISGVYQASFFNTLIFYNNRVLNEIKRIAKPYFIAYEIAKWDLYTTKFE